MSVCTFLGKYILYLFNLLCLISSFGILAIAFIIYKSFDKWSGVMNIETTPLVLAVIGLVLFLISFVGLCGVLKDSACLLTLFSILFSIVFIGELVFSGIVYNNHKEIESYALQEMESKITTYNQTGHEKFTHIWNVLQFDMQCCGINGPDDWKNVTHSDTLPKSCCKEIPYGGSCTKIDSFTNGCYVQFMTILQENNQLILWSAIGFGLIQLLAVCLACCRKCAIQDEYETV